MTLTREKLTLHLQDHLGLGKREVQQLVGRLFEIMKDSLSRGEDVLVSGFGKFSIRQKKARRGRNPQTKERIIVSARKVLVFKSSGILRKRINDG